MSENRAPAPAAAPPAGSVRQAIERCNRCLLRRTRPGRYWIVTSVKLGLAMFAISMTSAALVDAARYSLGFPIFISDEKPSISGLVFGSVLFAPVAETGLLMLVHLLTRRLLGLTGFALVTAALSGVAHYPIKGLPIAQIIGFFLMAYQYASYRDMIGIGR